MAVHNLDPFPYEYIPVDRESEKEPITKSIVADEVHTRHVVDFETIRQVPNASAFPAKSSRDHDDFMPSAHQALSYIIYVHLDTAQVWNKEVRHQRNSKPLPLLQLRLLYGLWF